MKIKKILKTICFTAALTLSTFAQATPLPVASNQNGSFNSQQVQQIQKIIHDYLVKNPQVLVEASQALQAQQMAKAESAALKAIGQNKQAIFNNAASPVAGNPNGNVILVEFFDYQCGHCKAMNTVVQSLVKKDKNLKVIFKELPIFGANSRYAAKAALASVKQGKYYQFHDALLATPNPLTNKKVLSVAKKVGLNVNQLKKDMDSKAINQQLRANFSLAQNLKLIGTPAFIVANKGLTKFQFIPGATSAASMQQAINTVEGNNNTANS